MNSISSVKDVVHTYLKEHDLSEQFTLIEAKEPTEERPIFLQFDAHLIAIRPDNDFLVNNTYVQKMVNIFYGLKSALNEIGVTADVQIRKVSLKGSHVSARSLVSVHNQDNRTFIISPDLLNHITSVNFSGTQVSPRGLDKVYTFANLSKLKLDYCKNITEVLEPQIVCPSLQTLSLVGTAMELKAGWQKKLAKKFPNLTLIDVTLGKNVLKSPGFLDVTTLSSCVNARIYSPCGHLFSKASRVDKLKPCPVCNTEIKHAYSVTKHITRFEKNINGSWRSTVVDVKRKPLQSGQVYFHKSCQQFFNGDTLKTIYGEDILEQMAKTDLHCIGCLQAGNKWTLKRLFKAFPELTENREDEKSQNLEIFADSCYLDEQNR